jgi:hypothetical protein
MRRLLELIWPMLEAWEPHELSEIREGNIDDIAAIRDTAWSQCPELALEEARRLASAEDERRRTAEAKATTCLLFAGALVPVLTYFEAAVWEGKVGTAPQWLSLPMLAVAVLYLIGACVWAFKTIGVATFHQIDVTELLRIWREEKLLPKLITEIFVVTRRNRDHINSKVSYVKLAHAFIFRAFVVFGVIVVLEAGWQTWRALQIDSKATAIEKNSGIENLPCGVAFALSQRRESAKGERKSDFACAHGRACSLS